VAGGGIPDRDRVGNVGVQYELEGVLMAKNGARGGGRVGAVRGRSQVPNPKTGLWTKRDTQTGRFTAAKNSGGSFKGVRKER
jgi:hypothetical protein